MAVKKDSILPISTIKTLRKLDEQSRLKQAQLKPPKYNPLNHYLEVARSDYFYNLVLLRHAIKVLCDDYMSNHVGAKNIDLFMLTPSISSPMGPGSDSEAIPIQFGNLHSFLTDSSQFGFEPIIMNGFDSVYCYLPSMRGEDPDKRHLNQFFHCEIEIRGNLEQVISIAEGFIVYLSAGLLECKNLVSTLSQSPEDTTRVLKELVVQEDFKQYSFDDAFTLLSNLGKPGFTHSTPEGRDIPSSGELKFMHSVKTTTPIWLTHFDRARVPFYQKPDPTQTDKVLNADLLFPPIAKNGFGGEILGAGQRQDSVTEILESLNQQGISKRPYEWYINLRNDVGYDVTSGFGLGIERYISWALGLNNIQDAILYPRIKNVLTTP